MRRWRTADDRFLVEGDLPSGVQFYRLDRAHNVDRLFREEIRSLGGELHKVTFTLLGRELVCRHTIDRGRVTEDESRVEFDRLEMLTPTEEPTERTCRDAIARFNLGEAKVEEAKREQVDRLAAAAPESIRPTFRRLAERVVFESDPMCRQMISVFAAFAALRKDAATDRAALAEVAPLLETAARHMTFDPGAKAVPPPTDSTKALDLVDAIDRLRADLIAAAPSSADSAALERAAAFLRHAALCLLRG